MTRAEGETDQELRKRHMKKDNSIEILVCTADA